MYITIDKVTPKVNILFMYEKQVVRSHGLFFSCSGLIKKLLIIRNNLLRNLDGWKMIGNITQHSKHHHLRNNIKHTIRIIPLKSW